MLRGDALIRNIPNGRTTAVAESPCQWNGSVRSTAFSGIWDPNPSRSQSTHWIVSTTMETMRRETVDGLHGHSNGIINDEVLDGRHPRGSIFGTTGVGFISSSSTERPSDR